ncbi:unnamed protein product [Danaus chrysippus]|uniref:(African queen) hypothetical protein n=1 Tax=Danaus chrysippus TaxID=151541 RepID=A0A8J2VXB9_9NEOP|nr:unnamed protein product [Danaus chrysippus]
METPQRIRHQISSNFRLHYHSKCGRFITHSNSLARFNYYKYGGYVGQAERWECCKEVVDGWGDMRTARGGEGPGGESGGGRTPVNRLSRSAPYRADGGYTSNLPTLDALAYI